MIKNGRIDDWLIESSSNLEQSGENYGKQKLKQFKAISDSGSSLFIENLSHINRLFHQTQEICIGRDSIYLVKGTMA